MQSVWVLVGDIRVTAVVLPYVMYKLNKIRWLSTGEGWEPPQHEPKHELECTHIVVETQHTVNEFKTKIAEETPLIQTPNKENTDAELKLKKALELKQRQLLQLSNTDSNTHALFTKSANANSSSEKASLISHLQQMSKHNSNTNMH
jgi:hypothetical protein